MKTLHLLSLIVLISSSIFSKLSHSSPLVLKVGDKCSPLQTVGQIFNSNASSLELTEGNSSRVNSIGIGECDPSMPLQCTSGRCTCKGGFTLSRNGSKCLEIARNELDSPCEENIQCWKGLLGRLSECNAKTGKCACYHSDTLPIVFHQGRCYYGESLGDFCQIDGLCAATTRNAECRGTCQCAEGYVGSWDKSRCLLIAKEGLESPCEENVQCENSSLGTLSQCNQVSMRCECYQIPMVPTLFHNSRCYFGAALGDVCQVDPQCHAVTPGSICNKDGKCQCGEGHVTSANSSLCLQIPSSDGSSLPDSHCMEDIQCQRALGTLSRCSPQNKKCECYLGRENETDYGGFYITTSMVIIGGKCHSSKALGQGCKLTKQCSARTENSICYNGICECIEESHVPSSDFRKCLPIAKAGLYGDCDEDDQCRRGPLGPLSYCNPIRKRCECSAILPVVLHKGRCYFHRPLGSPCSSHFDCQAGGNGLSECLSGRCQCRNGSQSSEYNLCLESNDSEGISVNLSFLICISFAQLIGYLG